MQPSWTVGDPIFNGHLQTAPVMTAIYMAGVTFANLESILEFIYKGDVQISLERLDDFLNTAQKLQVKGLLSDSDPIYKDKEPSSLDPATGMKLSAALKEKQTKKKKVRPPTKSTKSESETIILKETVHIAIDQPEEVVKEEVEESRHTIIEEISEPIEETMEIVEVEAAKGEEETQEETQAPNVGFDIGDWRIEMDDDKDDTPGFNDVLIDGKKVKHFINKIDKTFHCQLCDHNSKDKSNLVRHLKRRHTMPTHELCPHCGKTYKNKECLYNHMSSKRCLRGVNFNPRDPRILSFLRFDNEDKKWACTECGNKYRQKVYAREHVVFKHIGIESVSDNQDATTLTDPAISKLIEFVPTQNKWKCMHCGRLFSNSFNVSHHIEQKHPSGITVESDHSEAEESDSNV